MASKYITLEQGMILSSACEKMNAFFFGGKKAEKAIKLPAKIMYILGCGDYDEIISWSPNGESVVIKDTHRFAESVLPIFFKQSKFDSFSRKMRRWRFSTMRLHTPKGLEAWAFQHPHFTKAGGFAMCYKVVTSSSITAKAATSEFVNEIRREGRTGAAPQVGSNAERVVGVTIATSGRNNVSTTSTRSSNTISFDTGFTSDPFPFPPPLITTSVRENAALSLMHDTTPMMQMRTMPIVHTPMLDVFNVHADRRYRRQLVLETLSSFGQHNGSRRSAGEEIARLLIIQSILSNQP